MGCLRIVGVLTAAASVGLFASTVHAQFGDWPAVFDPLQLLTLNLEMDPGDWATVQSDETLDIEVPATFWADGETPILISVRRKSGDPLTEAQGFVKVSLKLDINEYVQGQSWHGLKKLSLENGDDEDVVREGLAWQLERLASGTQGYGYSAGHTAWVRLFINDVYTGVYVNVEQRDKRFLENRGLYVEGQTWLYKVSDVGSQELKVGGPQDSPTVEALCYEPFNPDQPCAQPDLATDVPLYVNMNGILTLMAADALQGNPDAMLSHGKNFYFADFLGGPTRMYFPWDRDSSLSGGSVNDGIYGGNSPYSSLLDVGEFRSQYNEIFNDLVCGPWSAGGLVALIDAVEPVLTDALAADPNNQLGDTVAEHFDSLRNWVTQRVANVIGEIEGFQPCPSIQVDLNEFMASNFGSLEDPDEPDEYPDWLEIHNPIGTAVDLGGLYLTDDGVVPMKYQIPAGVTIPANGYLVFWADDDDEQGPLHTNFKLGASGEEIYIYDTNGVTEIDSIVFGPQVTDVSYGRYPDGAGSWGFMAVPTPGDTNGPHNAPPTISGTTRTPELPTDADPVWITSTVTDDSAVVGVTLSYDSGGGWLDVTMLDDGAHNDGGPGDSVYGGQIPVFTNGTVVRYYVTALDDLGAARTDPVGAPSFAYSYFVGYTVLPIYINEFMADNETVIEDPDQPLAYEDWVELYNAGPAAVDLGGMYLTDDLTSPLKYQIPAGVSVPANGHLIFWTDDDAEQGPLHTNFKLSAFGEQIGLHDSDAFGNMPIDTLSFGPQTTDVSQGRCPDGTDNWQFFAEPTPEAPNQPCGTDTQACCLPGNTCQELDAVPCGGAGGMAQGTDTDCAAVECPDCIADTDCDDGIVCTIDSCDGATGSCAHAPFDVVCDNGLFCDGEETCNAALGCQGGTPVNCDDGIACTTDSCNEETASCDNIPNNSACDNGLFCDGAETCDAVLGCQAGIPVNCDDGVACTDDACNESTNSCDNVANDASCDNGQFCDGAETCDAALGCQAGTPVDCDDGVACTDDACNESTNSCDNVANDASCDNGLFCDGEETCDVSLGCQAGTPVDCTDAVSCTLDLCNETNKTCDHVPDDALCDNGQFCDGAESCHVTLGCQAGTDPCPDPDVTCDETNNVCTGCQDNADCDDGLFCNGVATCVKGICQAGAPPCDDGVACTLDFCNEDVKDCGHSPDNAFCDNGLVCDGTEFCHPVLDCLPGTPEDCDDGVTCTVDSCNLGTDSCDHTPDDALCGDDDECTLDTCDPGNPEAGGDGCVHEYQAQVYADICSPFCPPDCPQPGIDDILCELDDFADGASVSGCPGGCTGAGGPQRGTTDIHPCPEDGGGDGEIILDDILNLLDAFAGLHPCADPCP